MGGASKVASTQRCGSLSAKPLSVMIITGSTWPPQEMILESLAEGIDCVLSYGQVIMTWVACRERGESTLDL
jgi:hypothetical protein